MSGVIEINELNRLAELRPIWQRLLDETPGATFFHSLDWLETFWKFNGAGGHLRVLVVEDAGKPIGILPLCVLPEQTKAGSVRVLGYPLNGWGSFYGPIGANPYATLEAGLRHIHASQRDWDVFDLRWIDDEIDRGRTIQLMSTAGFSCDRQVWHESAQIELGRGWDRYWASRKSTWRSNVRRCERLLMQHGAVEHVRYRPRDAASGDGDPRWDLYDTCVELAQQSWQGNSTSGTTLSHDSVRDYLRAAHETAAKSGAVDLNLLLIGGKPVAYAYNYHFRGWAYGVRSGFDAAAAQDGAGNVLMAKMIEDSCHRGDQLIDLGPNYLECKRYWLTRLHPAYHVTHFNPKRLKAQALRVKRIVKQWLGWQRAAELPTLQSSSSRRFIAIGI